MNPFVKLGGLELFGVIERAQARRRPRRPNAVESVGGRRRLPIPPNKLFVGARYNKARATSGNAADVGRRWQFGGGWFITPGLLAKAEYVNQKSTATRYDHQRGAVQGHDARRRRRVLTGAAMTTVTRTDRESTGTGGCLRARQFCVVAALAALAAAGASAAESQPASVTVQRGARGLPGRRLLRDTAVECRRPGRPHRLRSHPALHARRAEQPHRRAARRPRSSSSRKPSRACSSSPGASTCCWRCTPSRDGSGSAIDAAGASRATEGIWTLSDRDGHAVVTYELLARPAFDVPEFLLTRLLKRDADRMIGRLQAEIAARAAGAPGR